MRRLLVATKNKGKLEELNALLTGMNVELVCLDGLDTVEVEETGSTFIENAERKARGYALQTALPAIADDSGIEVASLDRRPGVVSARYGGAETSYDRKIAMLLDEIDRSRTENRHARFVCAMAIADETGKIVHSGTGICDGKIANAPRGRHGFGYDPIFIPDGYDLTFGELTEHTKSQISHRARAFREIIPFLRHFIAN